MRKKKEGRKVSGVLSTDRHSKITAEELSRKWNIGLKTAEATMNLLAKVKSLLGNTVANIFTNGKFTKVVPLEARRFAGDLLVRFFDNVGVPEGVW